MTKTQKEWFEVWALCYDPNGEQKSEFDEFMGEFKTKEAAIDFAEKITKVEHVFIKEEYEKNGMLKYFPDKDTEVASIDLRVETCQEGSSDFIENIDTVYSKEIYWEN